MSNPKIKEHTLVTSSLPSGKIPNLPILLSVVSFPLVSLVIIDSHVFLFLFLTAPVSWKIQPQDIKSSVGQKIDIRCEAEGIPDPTVIISKKSPSTVVLNEVSRGIKSVVLRLDSLSYNDSGSYSCQAWNQGSAKISRDFVVYVSGQFAVRFDDLKRRSE
jgi:hypothetical protein